MKRCELLGDFDNIFNPMSLLDASNSVFSKDSGDIK